MLKDIDATHNRHASIQRTTFAQRRLRARIAAAFRKMCRGVDARTALAQTYAFYRSSRAAWARCLG
jgi:hypothetical protein